MKEILELTQDMDYKAFSGDTKTVKAVLYNLAIIGEASRSLPPEITEDYPSIPWREMSDLRNVLIHDISGLILRLSGKQSAMISLCCSRSSKIFFQDIEV